MTFRDRVCRNAALWFAEIQDIPVNYKTLQDKYPTGKPDAVVRRTWKKEFRDWDTFIQNVKTLEPELCALALNPPPKEPVVEKKDPLESLRASTTEKTYE
mgnify:CR=1 FL=1